MKEIAEVIDEQAADQQKEQDRQGLASDIGSHFDGASMKMSGDMQKFMSEFTKQIVAVLSKKLDVKIDKIEFPGINMPDVHVLPIETDRIIKAIQNTKVSPIIKVAAPDVNVNVPAAKVVVKPQVTQSAPAEVPSRITEEKELYRDGFYDGFEEKFSDGTLHTVTGYSRGRIKHKWA